MPSVMPVSAQADSRLIPPAGIGYLDQSEARVRLPAQTDPAGRRRGSTSWHGIYSHRSGIRHKPGY
jgi:hypothetical protein